MKNSKNDYLNFLSEILTENTDDEIYNFMNDLLEGIELRGKILKEAAAEKKSDKKALATGAAAGSVGTGVGVAGGVAAVKGWKKLKARGEKVMDAKTKTMINKLREFDPAGRHAIQSDYIADVKKAAELDRAANFAKNKTGAKNTAKKIGFGALDVAKSTKTGIAKKIPQPVRAGIMRAIRRGK